MYEEEKKSTEKKEFMAEKALRLKIKIGERTFQVLNTGMRMCAFTGDIGKRRFVRQGARAEREKRGRVLKGEKYGWTHFGRCSILKT